MPVNEWGSLETECHTCEGRGVVGWDDEEEACSNCGGTGVMLLLSRAEKEHRRAAERDEDEP